MLEVMNLHEHDYNERLEFKFDKDGSQELRELRDSGKVSLMHSGPIQKRH